MEQEDLFEEEGARALLDQLISDSQLYTRSEDFFELLDFVARMRNFAPFNAMLLAIQKPGLRFAASFDDWLKRFGRTPKPDARPLLILWPFGPIALVYDAIDTEGDDLPEDVWTFFAKGPITDRQISGFIDRLELRHIRWKWMDVGDQSAGSISVLSRATDRRNWTIYEMRINCNHTPPMQFASVVHELAHLYLGHLGHDDKLGAPKRRHLEKHIQEIEAESVSFLVCARNGVRSKSESYLSSYVQKNTTVDDIDLYQIMKAAGQIERLLGLTWESKYERCTAMNAVMRTGRPQSRTVVDRSRISDRMDALSVVTEMN